MPVSPSSDNYQIPTGKAYFKKTGESIRELGNIVEMKIANEVTTKDHFKNSGGKRTKDKTVITQVGATITFTMDEITKENLAIFALGDLSTDTDGNGEITGMTEALFEGTLTVVGDNDTGPRIEWVGDVSFIPQADFFFIKNDDEYNIIQVQASVKEDANGNFGVWTHREPV